MSGSDRWVKAFIAGCGAIALCGCALIVLRSLGLHHIAERLAWIALASIEIVSATVGLWLTKK